MDRYGFPRTQPKPRLSRIHGFRAGDLVQVRVPSGKRQGIHQGWGDVCATGTFSITAANGVVQDIAHGFCRKIQSADGYHYNLGGREDAHPLARQMMASSRGIDETPKRMA